MLRHYSYSSADGKFKPILLYGAQIDQLRPLFNKESIEYLQGKGKTPTGAITDIVNSTIHDQNHNNLQRVQRAFLFITIARCSDIIPIKISNYSAAMECLFSISSNDNFKNFGPRVTKYLDLTVDQDEKLLECYQIRNKYLHGSLLKGDPTYNYLSPLSQFMDSICRSAFNKILFNDRDIFNTNGKDLEKFLDQKG